MNSKVNYLLLTIIALGLSWSCKYSLSGYNINGKTAKVAYFDNQAPIQSANLTQIFTNKLESAILRDTPLQLVRDNPEIEFSGIITDYRLSPAAVSGEDDTEQTKLEVTVKVTYTNTLDESLNFTESFRGNQNYDASLDLAQVEEDLLDDISDQIVTSIFNRAFIDW